MATWGDLVAVGRSLGPQANLKQHCIMLWFLPSINKSMSRSITADHIYRKVVVNSLRDLMVPFNQTDSPSQDCITLEDIMTLPIPGHYRLYVADNPARDVVLTLNGDVDLRI